MKKAKDYYERGLSLKQEIQNETDIIISLIGIGNTEAKPVTLRKLKVILRRVLSKP